VTILHQSLRQGHVLAELVSNYADPINYDYQVADDTNQYWEKFVKNFALDDHFLPSLMRTSLFLDMIYQILLPYIPQNFQSREHILLVRTGTEELIFTERIYVSKLIKLTYYIARLNKSENEFDALLKMLTQLSDMHHQILLTLECPDLDKSQQTRVIDFFRNILTIEDLYQKWIQSRCEESNQLRPLLALQAKLPFSTETDVTQTLSSYMLLPMQRICRYQLLLHTIAQETKDARFDVLERRMQRYIERINACRKTADIHSRIKNWTAQTEFLLDYSCEDEANVEIIYENKAPKQRLLLRYANSFLLLKNIGDDLHVAGLIVYGDIMDIAVVDDRTLIIHFQSFGRRSKMIVVFPTALAYHWYDKYVTEMHQKM